MSQDQLQFGDFPGSLVVNTPLPLQGVWVQLLVGELRSHGKINKYNSRVNGFFFSFVIAYRHQVNILI